MNNLAKKKPLSTNQQAFRKEQNRLRAAQRRLEKQGYYFTEPIVPDMPKRVTKKALQDIRALKPQDLRMKALWVNPNTGELMGTGLDLYNLQRRRKSEKLSRAGMRPENVNRLRTYAARRSKKPIGSWEDYQAKAEASYYEQQKMISYTYDVQIVPHWENLWTSLEDEYTVHEIVEALTDVDGVPEPAYMPDPAYQMQQYFRFSGNLMRAIKSLSGDKIPPKVNDSIQQLSADFTDEYVLTEDELDDIRYHDLKRGTTWKEPRID